MTLRVLVSYNYENTFDFLKFAVHAKSSLIFIYEISEWTCIQVKSISEHCMIYFLGNISIFLRFFGDFEMFFSYACRAS